MFYYLIYLCEAQHKIQLTWGGNINSESVRSNAYDEIMMTTVKSFTILLIV